MGRPEARQMMEDYKKRMRDRQLKSRLAPETTTLRKKIAKPGASLTLSEASKAIARKWLWEARTSLEERRAVKAGDLYKQIDDAVAKMPPKDDWFYTSALRMEGEQLSQKGHNLQQERRSVLNQAEVKIKRMQNDLAQHERVTNAKIESEKKKLQNHEKSERERLEAQLQKRKSEILAHKAAKEKEFKEKSASLSEFRLKDATVKHRKEMAGIDSSIRMERDRLLKNFEREMTQQRETMLKTHSNIKQQLIRRKTDLQSKISRLNEQMLQNVAGKENEWRKKALIWLNQANKKFQKNKEADEEHIAKSRAGRRRK